MSIFERHAALQRQERKERAALLAPLNERYRPLYEALQDECGRAPGHEWRHAHWNVGGERVLRCQQCAKTKVEGKV